MAVTNKTIDAYIATSAPFAQPVLKRLRKLVHHACPEVKEVIKWGFPNFDYKGSILCNMAAFKHHCSFGFWKASLMSNPDKIFSKEGKIGMGHLGQIKSIDDLPSDKILIKYIKEAIKLTDEGVKIPARTKTALKKELIVPDYFKKELSKNKKALKVFDSFSYSNKKEYVQWITEAKTDETRDRRIEQSVNWIAEGKSRNWKYMGK